MTPPNPVVFLLDIDNTLLDNDRIVQDLRRYLHKEAGAECGARYWQIIEELRTELGYVDYLGAFQRLRLENARNNRLSEIASFLLDYPFGDRLYPDALEVIAQLRDRGPVVILSDGDAVFKSWKIGRSGLREAVEEEVLIYVHKEEMLEDVERRYPGEHYVLVDGKLRILTAVKKVWGALVTTVFPRQGHYARDPRNGESYPPADVTIERVGDLLQHDLAATIASVRNEKLRSASASRDSST